MRCTRSVWSSRGRVPLTGTRKSRLQTARYIRRSAQGSQCARSALVRRRHALRYAQNNASIYFFSTSDRRSAPPACGPPFVVSSAQWAFPKLRPASVCFHRYASYPTMNCEEEHPLREGLCSTLIRLSLEILRNYKREHSHGAENKAVWHPGPTSAANITHCTASSAL